MALIGLGCSVKGTSQSNDSPNGQLAIALVSSKGADEYRFVGTIAILNGDGGVAATISTHPASPGTHSVLLLQGAYSVEVLEGYYCTYAGAQEDYESCTFVQATPDPFNIIAGEITSVALKFTFHFGQDDDVRVAFRTGSAGFSLNPQDDIPSCGERPWCESGAICASLDGENPRCYATCEQDTDCQRGPCVSVVETNPNRHYGLCASSEIIEVAAGDSHTCALSDDGRVFC